jgi:hypothetical protein
MRRYPKEITQLVADLAQTPGVARVLIRESTDSRLKPIQVWPSRFKPDSAIYVGKNEYVHVEGEWSSDTYGLGQCDMAEFLNYLRERAGLKTIRIKAERTNGKLSAFDEDGPCNRWEGDIFITEIE